MTPRKKFAVDADRTRRRTLPGLLVPGRPGPCLDSGSPRRPREDGPGTFSDYLSMAPRSRPKQSGSTVARPVYGKTISTSPGRSSASPSKNEETSCALPVRRHFPNQDPATAKPIGKELEKELREILKLEPPSPRRARQRTNLPRRKPTKVRRPTRTASPRITHRLRSEGDLAAKRTDGRP